jgi:hypothetical protein
MIYEANHPEKYVSRKFCFCFCIFLFRTHTQHKSLNVLNTSYVSDTRVIRVGLCISVWARLNYSKMLSSVAHTPQTKCIGVI